MGTKSTKGCQDSGSGLADKVLGDDREAGDVGEVGLLATNIELVGEIGDCRSPVDPFERLREIYGRGGGR